MRSVIGRGAVSRRAPWCASRCCCRARSCGRAPRGAGRARRRRRDLRRRHGRLGRRRHCAGRPAGLVRADLPAGGLASPRSTTTSASPRAAWPARAATPCLRRATPLGHRRGGDRLGHRLGDAAVEHARDDVVRVQLVRRDDAGDRLRGGELHLLVDRLRAHVERALEHAREREHVVDLVRVVRAPGGHDRDVARATSSGWTSGTGLAIANTIASARHRAHAGGGERARAGEAEHDVGAGQHLVGGAAHVALVRALGELRAIGVEALLARRTARPRGCRRSRRRRPGRA